MIPKIIHYCWFGKEAKSSQILKYINTWKSKLPEWEIIEWNEDNTDLDEYPFAKEAYKMKKYAFVSDVIRLKVIYENGGIYLDTDIEILKDLSSFLNLPAFMSFENSINVGTGVIGAEKGNIYIYEWLSKYKNRKFCINNKLNMTTNVTYITNDLKEKGLILNGEKQNINDIIHIFPIDYFSCKSYITGEIFLTPNSHAIHHFQTSWKPWYFIFYMECKRRINRFLKKKNKI